jgi:hypothetical protein
MNDARTCRDCGHVSTWPGFHMTRGLCDRCYARQPSSEAPPQDKDMRSLWGGFHDRQVLLARVSAKGASRREVR